jgi:hypothetical protein
MGPSFFALATHSTMHMGCDRLPVGVAKPADQSFQRFIFFWRELATDAD